MLWILFVIVEFRAYYAIVRRTDRIRKETTDSVALGNYPGIKGTHQRVYPKFFLLPEALNVSQLIGELEEVGGFYITTHRKRRCPWLRSMGMGKASLDLQKLVFSHFPSPSAPSTPYF